MPRDATSAIDIGPPDSPTDARRATGDREDFRCGTRANVGGNCVSGECLEPWMCLDPIDGTTPTLRRDGSEGRPYPVRIWPGGLCTGECDLLAEAWRSPCGRCATCAPFVDGIGRCRLTCEQDVDGRGGCSEGYACDRGELYCRDACVVVEGVDTCQFTHEDRDGDGSFESIVDEGVAHPSACNSATGLCETVGRVDATAGDDCVTDFDCEDDGTCVRSDATEPITTLSDGYCIRRGCNETDLPCREGDVCAHSLFELPGGACMQGCEVGEEMTAAERLGAAGRHPQCGPNEACFWDGTHGLSDPLNGACYPGNYNDVPAYNVGAECQRDEECWSPFGLGRCLFLDDDAFLDDAYARTGRGICAVGGCGETAGEPIGLHVADGVVPVERPEDLCRTSASGGTDLCLGFTELQNYCIHGCADATACPDGWACPNLGDTLRPLHVCWPMCLADTDCRTGARCLDDSDEACDSPTDTCFCTDATAPVDAGVEPHDASTGEDAGADAP